jgi:pantothenate kinase type III
MGRHKLSSEPSMIVAIDLGGTRTKFGLVDHGQVVASSTCPADAQGSLEGHLDELLHRLRGLCAEQGLALEACEGIGWCAVGIAW